MDSVKYIGLDVHRDTISVAVVDQSGRLVMQSVIPTQASAILDCVSGIQGSLHVTLEEGTHSAWLYDLLVQRVTLARKIAAITLKIWKKGEAFNPEHLKSQAA